MTYGRYFDKSSTNMSNKLLNNNFLTTKRQRSATSIDSFEISDTEEIMREKPKRGRRVGKARK